VSGLGCLSAEECLDYVARATSAPATERIHRHITTCSTCFTLLAEAARGEATTSDGPHLFSTLTVGERISDRYEVRRFIARGGMGEVYEVFDHALSETLALKTLALTAVDQAAAADRFLSEVRLARKVTHPNVCRILEFGIHKRGGQEADLVPFLTMELLQGETLGSFVGRKGPLDAATVVGILGGVLGALEAIHGAGIVHRDLKSDNVFITLTAAGEPRAVVMDFGLARPLTAEASRSSSTSAVIGTLAYMAPEQLEGKPATPLSDIYAVGVIAFEALTGRLPFVADAPFAAAAKKLSEAAPRPSALARGLDAGWDDLILRCLDRDPQRRPPHVAAVTAALAKLGVRRAPRRRTATLVAAAACAIVLGMAGFSNRGGSAPAAAPIVAAPPTTPTRPQLTPTEAPKPPPTPAAAPPAIERSAPVPREGGAPRQKNGKNAAHATPAIPDEPAPIESPRTEAPPTPAPPERPKLRHPDDLINPFRAAP
jgi:tRNA A-37 threonylcarbamoyl transferase component Bud32